MKRGVYSVLSDISNNKYDLIMDGILSFGTVLNMCECGIDVQQMFPDCLSTYMLKIQRWLQYIRDIYFTGLDILLTFPI